MKIPSKLFNEDGDEFVDITEDFTDDPPLQQPPKPTKQLNPQPTKIAFDEFDLKLFKLIEDLEQQEELEKSENLASSSAAVECGISDSFGNLNLAGNVPSMKDKFPSNEEVMHHDKHSSLKKVHFAKEPSGKKVHFADDPSNLDEEYLAANVVSDSLKTIKDVVVEHYSDEENVPSEPLENRHQKPVQEFVTERESACSSEESENELDDVMFGREISMEYIRKRNHFIQAKVLNTTNEMLNED